MVEAERGRREGGGNPERKAIRAWRMKSRQDRCCRRQVSTTDRMRATKVLPRVEWVPYDNRRQITGCRSARSALLLVGSTPGYLVKDQSASHRASRLRQVSAVFGEGHWAPIINQCWRWVWIAGSSGSNVARGKTPRRT